MSTLSAARLSLLASTGLLALKYFAYRVTGSVALYSDAIESIVNVVAGGIATLAMWVSGRPADDNHPYGHTKAEYISATLEGGFIVLAAVAIIRSAWPRLLSPVAVPSLGAGLGFSLAATALNGALATCLVKTGRKRRSPALVGNGMHIWSDVVTSVGVVAGVAVAWVTGWWVLDPLLAILVALNILRVGWRIVRESAGGLMDEGLPGPELARVETTIAANLSSGVEAHDIKTRRAGPRTFIEFHLVVPADTTAQDAHDDCDRLEAALQREVGDAQVTVHVEPHTVHASHNRKSPG